MSPLGDPLLDSLQACHAFFHSWRAFERNFEFAFEFEHRQSHEQTVEAIIGEIGSDFVRKIVIPALLRAWRMRRILSVGSVI